MKKQFHKKSTILFFLNLVIIVSFGQRSNNKNFVLTLEETIALACDSTLDAMVSQNTVFVEYLVYKNYKAGKLPSISFNSTPFNFNRSVNEEYNFVDSTYHYIDQQIINSSFSLSLNQPISKTGGQVYINSDLSRLQNIGRNTPDQYSSNIVKIGITQQLFGFNTYKWDERLTPLRYEKAKMEYIESLQSLSLEAISYFFGLLEAQNEFNIAKTNLNNADTLLLIGKKRYELGTLSLEDLYLLEINSLRSKNEVKTSSQNFEKAKNELYSFLRLDEDKIVELSIPVNISPTQINAAKAITFSLDNNPQTFENRVKLLEVQRDKERAKINKHFSSSLNASIGLNKTASSLVEVYETPVNHQTVNLSIRIPIVDWGVAKNSFEIAERNEKITRLLIEKSNNDFEQEVFSTVFNFNMLYETVITAIKIKELAQKSYMLNLDGFKIGKTNLTQLFEAQSYSIIAQREYLNAIESYWYNLYKIRQYTLYDFINEESLTEEFEKIFEVKTFNER